MCRCPRATCTSGKKSCRRVARSPNLLARYWAGIGVAQPKQASICPGALHSLTATNTLFSWRHFAIHRRARSCTAWMQPARNPTCCIYINLLLNLQDVTLHDLDAANARPQGGQDILSMMGQVGASRCFVWPIRLQAVVRRFTVQGMLHAETLEVQLLPFGSHLCVI